MQANRNHLNDLNPEQRQAVEHVEGPLLIFAGAGSGKTRVLTRRIAHLVLECDVHPGRIFAVTFTNKAAREMKARVASLFDGTRAAPSWVATFHSSCARILRKHAEELDYMPNFAIYDRSESQSVLKRVYKRLNIDPKMVEPKMVANKIDRAKNEFRFPDDVRNDRHLPSPLAQIIADLYEGYQAELKQCNAMDFNDLICNVLMLFKLEPAILARYQDQFQHVLIDEYQDTNRVQYLLVRALTEKNHNICVVGDDDQSIYAFRGATIENILNFQQDFPEAKVVTLVQNYRSTKTILGAANAIIAKNAQRQKKQLRTENPAGKPITCFVTGDEMEEAAFVTREMSALVKQGTPSKEIAIFYRTNAQSRAIEEALVEHGIPYEIYGGHRFYDRKEIKDVLAYFRLLLNPNDNEAFLRIINTPTRGIGATSVGKLVAYAQEQKLSIMMALRRALEVKAAFMSGAAQKKFAAFNDLISELEEERLATEEILRGEISDALSSERANALANLLEHIADRTDYLERLKKEDTTEARNRIENIYELFAVAGEFVGAALDEGLTPTLHDFLDRTSLATDLDNPSDEDEQSTQNKFTAPVSLMTIHLAKGLEFDVVFMVGLEEGLLPHVHSLENNAELEEERRLCYVGFTRARKRLFLTRAHSRRSFGRYRWYSGMASRFIDDLPENLIDDRQSNFLSSY